jgi:hypothetical protein
MPTQLPNPTQPSPRHGDGGLWRRRRSSAETAGAGARLASQHAHQTCQQRRDEVRLGGRGALVVACARRIALLPMALRSRDAAQWHVAAGRVALQLGDQPSIHLPVHPTPPRRHATLHPPCTRPPQHDVQGDRVLRGDLPCRAAGDAMRDRPCGVRRACGAVGACRFTGG